MLLSGHVSQTNQLELEEVFEHIVSPFQRCVIVVSVHLHDISEHAIPSSQILVTVTAYCSS